MWYWVDEPAQKERELTTEEFFLEFLDFFCDEDDVKTEFEEWWDGMYDDEQGLLI